MGGASGRAWPSGDDSGPWSQPAGTAAAATGWAPVWRTAAEPPLIRAFAEASSDAGRLRD
ncbi:hypothetical protein FKN01_17435 [Streptomyces sp. 130]|nr:hypothetical protein FKN01_17435 [Streptomyces sp. 130]